MTKDLIKRIKEHNTGKTKSTSPYVPWKLIYQESFEDYKEARHREKWLKTGTGRDFIKNKLDP